MPFPGGALFTLGLAILGVALLGYGGRGLAPVYRMWHGDPVAVRDLEHREGPVEVQGTAVGDGRAVVAPFSGRECLACRYAVDEYRSAGKHSHWETLTEGAGGVPFLVDDGTGTVPVDPAGADLRLEAHTTRVDAGDEPPERIAEYVQQTDPVDPNDQTWDLGVLELHVGNDQRFLERRLDPGEDVYVYGSVARPAEAPAWGSDRVDAEIGGGNPFVVSDTSERKTAWRIARRPLAVAVAGAAILFVLGLIVLGVP